MAVSKLKPAEDIQALYDAGVRHFGENYPQELCDKAAQVCTINYSTLFLTAPCSLQPLRSDRHRPASPSPLIAPFSQLPSDIAWHFIGALQSNKSKPLASIPNLFAVETLTSTKAASLLAKTVAGLSPPRPDRLNVFLQLNTSNEDSKAGLAPTLAAGGEGGPSELLALALHVLATCPELRLKGLMTIGSFDASHAEGEANPDFATLVRCAGELVEALRKEVEGGKGEIKEGVEEIEREGLELSMGMSDDFVQAIKQGSSNVRVGSRIFGARPPRKP